MYRENDNRASVILNVVIVGILIPPSVTTAMTPTTAASGTKSAQIIQNVLDTSKFP